MFAEQMIAKNVLPQFAIIVAHVAIVNSSIEVTNINMMEEYFETIDWQVINNIIKLIGAPLIIIALIAIPSLITYFLSPTKKQIERQKKLMEEQKNKLNKKEFSSLSDEDISFIFKIIWLFIKASIPFVIMVIYGIIAGILAYMIVFNKSIMDLLTWKPCSNVDEDPRIPLPSQDKIISPLQTSTVNECKNPAKLTNNIIVSVIQKVIDKNGRAIFLAEVEIIDSVSLETLTKVRTNGAGKWVASLKPGTYKVLIRKRDSLNKEKMEASQIISVNGESSKLDLPQIKLNIKYDPNIEL